MPSGSSFVYANIKVFIYFQFWNVKHQPGVSTLRIQSAVVISIFTMSFNGMDILQSFNRFMVDRSDHYLARLETSPGFMWFAIFVNYYLMLDLGQSYL